MMSNDHMILDFFKIASNLKDVKRQGWIDKINLENTESVADHSYSMAIMSMVFSDSNNYNTEKILKMVLLHDLAESLVGDMVPDQIDTDKKKELENEAFENIMEKLPENIKNHYSQIWNEYQKNTTNESQIVHQIDKLEMALQAKNYQNKGYSKEKLESFFNSAESEITDKRLKEIFNNIRKE